MKKLVMVMGLSLMAASVWASCMGPFCWDDQGAYINGVIKDGNGDAAPSLTLAQINAAKPRTAGQRVYCSDCVRSYVCISSGTTRGAYTVEVESGTMTNAPTHCL